MNDIQRAVSELRCIDTDCEYQYTLPELRQVCSHPNKYIDGGTWLNADWDITVCKKKKNTGEALKGGFHFKYIKECYLWKKGEER